MKTVKNIILSTNSCSLWVSQSLSHSVTQSLSLPVSQSLSHSVTHQNQYISISKTPQFATGECQILWELLSAAEKDSNFYPAGEQSFRALSLDWDFDLINIKIF